MMRPRVGAAGTIAILALAACGAHAEPSRLAVSMFASESAPALLAQRAIERRWGPSEDSLYRVVELPAWRQEGLALAWSAALPGAGQVYSGDRFAGVAFAAAEAIGWVSHLVWRGRGETLREQSETFAGSPVEPGSTWSFDRWAAASQTDPSELRTLYEADRKTFYDLIGSDPRYLAGWAGDPTATRGTFSELRRHSDARLRNARYAAVGVWLNHVVAATHALRAARVHNLPLQHDLDLRLKSGWRNGPTVYAVIERRF